MADIWDDDKNNEWSTQPTNVDFEESKAPQAAADWEDTKFDRRPRIQDRGDRRPGRAGERGSGRRGDRRPDRGSNRGSDSQPYRSGGGDRDYDSQPHRGGDSTGWDSEPTNRGGDSTGWDSEPTNRGGDTTDWDSEPNRGPARRPQTDYPLDDSRGRRPRDRGRRVRFSTGAQVQAERVVVKKRHFHQNDHTFTSTLEFDDEQVQLDPESHLKSAKEWAELAINPALLAALETNGYNYPSKIQALGIEYILNFPEQSLLAQGPNGAGKTACFVLASLTRVDVSDPRPQIVCISHTVELSHQTLHEYEKFAPCVNVSLVSLSRPNSEETAQVIVTTQGVLLKALKGKYLDISGLKMFIVDEADHLMNSQSNEHAYRMLTTCIREEFPQSVQFLMVSATFPQTVKVDIAQVINQFYEITIKNEELMMETITHYSLSVTQARKIEDFLILLKHLTGGITIAFVNTCAFAERVYLKCRDAGYKAALLMGKDMRIDERNLTMGDFKQGKYTLLVTTNLLARGIDNTMVKTVVNFDLPRQFRSRDLDSELYLHRSGRCSRFGRHGINISLVASEEEQEKLKQIEEFYGISIAHLDTIEELAELERKTAQEEVKVEETKDI